MSNFARKYPLFVNEYFMKCANLFMKTVMKGALQIEHYWGGVEFAPGRGAIHLHVVAIAKDRAYLHDFYKAPTLEGKAKVLNDYAIERICPSRGSIGYAQVEGVSTRFGVDSELASHLSHGIRVSETAECWEKVQRTSARPHVDLVPGGNGTGTCLTHADT